MSSETLKAGIGAAVAVDGLKVKYEEWGWEGVVEGWQGCL